jgi:SPP1 gp7 family putative phage head morphogenesis protein
VLAADDQALTRIRGDAAALAQAQQRALERGETVSPSWLYRQRRYRVLEATILREVARLESVVEQQTRRAQSNVIPIGARAALRDVAQYAPTRRARATIEQQWGLFDPASVERIIGNTATGRPLGSLLAGFGPAARDRVTRAMVVGIIAGHGPRRTATAVRDAMGTTASHALTITRTETLRAYREARIDSMRQSGVVDAWTWICSFGPRTCPACWAMHGSVHPMSEPFGSHPNCRCTPVPRTISWAELGIDAPDTTPFVEQGSSVFARLPGHEQARILGPGGHELYRNGVPLNAFAQRTVGPYGLGLRRVPNRDLQHLQRRPPFVAPVP